MTQRQFNVLFPCTGNSARSIMAEAIMNRKGFPNVTAYSAGSHPAGQVNREALKQIANAGLPSEGLRGKSREEFSKPGALEMHFIFTVCDRAAQEVCPVWPGQPQSGRWTVPDPAAVTGTPVQIERASSEAFMNLDRRITLFLCLPLATLERDAIQREIDRIGRSGAATIEDK